MQSKLNNYQYKHLMMNMCGKGIGRPAGRPSGEVEQLRKKVADLEQLAGELLLKRM